MFDSVTGEARRAPSDDVGVTEPIREADES
jgi:hypothetical protein